jgi:hypothetical protein
MTSRRTASGLGVQYPYHKENPFSIPPAVTLFGVGERLRQEVEEERDSIRTLSLAERADKLHPSLPDYISRSSQRGGSMRPAPSVCCESRQMAAESDRRVSEFIQHKREIYQLHLIMDGKQKEINEIAAVIRRSEAELAEAEWQAQQTATQIKLYRVGAQDDLTLATKQMQAATEKRIQAVQHLKIVEKSVASKRSRIAKLSAKLEGLRFVGDFLNSLVPEGKTVWQIFTNPQKFIEEFDKIEQQNLWIIRNVRSYQELDDCSLVALGRKLAETEATMKDIRQKTEALGDVDPIPCDLQTSDSQDRELARLTGLITKSYQACFKKDTNMSSLLQLERIETEFERMYAQMERISPEFIQQRHVAQQKERREIERTIWQKQQLEDQKTKIAQARERANKPVSRNQGRPLVPRTQLRPRVTKNLAKIAAMQREKARIEHLLYGDIFQ